MKRLRELLAERARRKKKRTAAGHHPDISDTKEKRLDSDISDTRAKRDEKFVPLTEEELAKVFNKGLEREPRRPLCDDEEEEEWRKW